MITTQQNLQNHLNDGSITQEEYKSNEKARESAEKHHGNPDKEKDKEATPFR